MLERYTFRKIKMNDSSPEHRDDRGGRRGQKKNEGRRQTPVITPALKKISAYGLGPKRVRNSRTACRRLSFSDENGESLTQVSRCVYLYCQTTSR